MSDEAAGGPVPGAGQDAGRSAPHGAEHAVGQDTGRAAGLDEARTEPAEGPLDEDEAFPAVPPPDPTGDPRVDAALARLGDLTGRPVSEHVEVYEDVHRRLQEILASAGQDGPAGAAPASSEASAPSATGFPAEGAAGGAGPARPRPAFPAALRPGGAT